MNLLIIDDHPMIINGFKSVFGMMEKYNVFEAYNTNEAMNVILKQNIDLIMVDLRLGNEKGIDIIYKVKQLNKNSKIIIFTSFLSEDDFYKGEELSVDGYIMKEAFVEDIVYAINTVCRGRKYYDPCINSYRNSKKKEYFINELTNREKDVLKEICKGLSNDDIAKKLFLSENTVKKHVSNILAKMNLRHRTQLMYYCNTSKSKGV